MKRRETTSDTELLKTFPTFLFIVLIVTALFYLFPGHIFAGTAKNGDQDIIKRFLLVVGANDGGRGRVKLRYAVSDAQAILKVMEDMGGVQPDDGRLLIQPNREALFWELERLNLRVNRAKKKHRRVEVLFYYSGHSSAKHILLGKEKIKYEDFKERLDNLDAHVRIAILDSCASGAFTRLKGGKKKAPFLHDSAYDMKGYAVMTSSSSDEASQESDRLAGSFFTHFLTSGLRGAADMSRDGRVTLSEAYQFAFNETLAQTEKTLSGPQHPNYNIKMSGTGDVIMTDLRESAELLTIAEDVEGRLFLHNPKNVLVVELNKTPGRTIELGLEHGKYRAISILNGNVYEAYIDIPKKKTAVLKVKHFKQIKKLDSVARGDLKYRQRRSTIKKRGKTYFFGALVTKLTSFDEKGAVMMGGKFGLNFGGVFSVGVVGYGNTNDILGHPTYWGFTFDYTFPSPKVLNLRVGGLIGSGAEYLLANRFFIVEPEIDLVVNVTRSFRVAAGLSFRYTSIKDSQFAPISLSLGLEYGKL